MPKVHHFVVLIFYFSQFLKVNAMQIAPTAQQIKNSDGVTHTVTSYVMVPKTSGTVHTVDPKNGYNERPMLYYSTYQPGVKSYVQYPQYQSRYNFYGNKVDTLPSAGNFQSIGAGQISTGQMKTNYYKTGYDKYYNDIGRNGQLANNNNNIVNQAYNFKYKDIYYPGEKKSFTVNTDVVAKMNKDVEHYQHTKETQLGNEAHGFNNQEPLGDIPSPFTTGYQDIQIKQANNNHMNIKAYFDKLQRSSSTINYTDIETIVSSILAENLNLRLKFQDAIKYLKDPSHVKVNGEICKHPIQVDQCWKTYINALPAYIGYKVEKIRLILHIIELFKIEMNLGLPIHHIFRKITITLKESMGLNLDDVDELVHKIYTNRGFNNSYSMKQNIRYVFKKILLRIDKTNLTNGKQLQISDIQNTIDQFIKKIIHATGKSYSREGVASNVVMNWVKTPDHSLLVANEMKSNLDTNKKNQFHGDKNALYPNSDLYDEYNSSINKGWETTSINHTQLINNQNSMISREDNEKYLVKPLDTEATDIDKIQNDFEIKYINENTKLSKQKSEKISKIDNKDIVNDDKLLIDLMGRFNDETNVISKNNAINEYMYHFNGNNEAIKAKELFNIESGVENTTDTKVSVESSNMKFVDEAHTTLNTKVDIVKPIVTNKAQIGVKETSDNYIQDLKHYKKDAQNEQINLELPLKEPENSKDVKIFVVQEKLENNVHIPEELSKISIPSNDRERQLILEYILGNGQQKNMTFFDYTHSYVSNNEKGLDYKPYVINVNKYFNVDPQFILKSILDSLELSGEKYQNTKHIPSHVFSLSDYDMLPKTETKKYFSSSSDIAFLSNEKSVDELNSRLQLELDNLMRMVKSDDQVKDVNAKTAHELESKFSNSIMEHLLTMKSSKMAKKLENSLFLLYKILKYIVTLLIRKGMPIYQIKQLILDIKEELHSMGLLHVSKCLEELNWRYITNIHAQFQNIINNYKLLP